MWTCTFEKDSSVVSIGLYSALRREWPGMRNAGMPNCATECHMRRAHHRELWQQLISNVGPADDELFRNVVRWSNNVLHTLLPPPSTASQQRYNLRHRAHTRLLPEQSTHLSDCNFLTRMLLRTHIGFFFHNTQIFIHSLLHTRRPTDFTFYIYADLRFTVHIPFVTIAFCQLS